MRRLYIHIGAKKAGSTSLQQALAENSYKMRANGVHYVSAGRQRLIGPHYSICTAAAALNEASSKKLFQELTSEIANSKEHTFLISAESFESLTRSEALQPFFEIKRRLGLELSIVYLVRSHAEHMNSTYVQLVRQFDIDTTFEIFVRPRLKRSARRFRRCIEYWSPLADRTIVMEFSVGAVERFIETEFGTKLSLPHVNQSINPLAVEALRLCRKRLLETENPESVLRTKHHVVVEAILARAREFDSSYGKFWGFSQPQFDQFKAACQTDRQYLKETFGVELQPDRNRERTEILPPYRDSDKQVLDYLRFG
jgi:hypothetical protein